MTRIIDDSNWQQLIEENAAAGIVNAAMPRETPIGGLECAAVYAEHVELIPESKWIDRTKAMTAAGGFIGDRIQFDPKAHFQNGLGFCWAYSLCEAVEAERVDSGLEFELLAPESLAELTGYRNRGYYLDRALEYAAKNGIARRQFVPQYKLSPQQWQAGWEQDRANFVPLEWWDIGGKDVWAETVTILLSGKGCYVGLDWWGHAVFYDRLVLDGNRLGIHTPNSHGPGQDVNLFGSKAIPSMGSFGVRSVTWSKP
jgi:hypothetical protein